MSIELAFLEVARVAFRLEMIRNRPSIAEIQARICERYSLRAIDMVSARRSRYVARPRQIAMFLCRELTTRSLPQIGRAFGGRDHTTVMHACRQIERLRGEDAGIAAAVDELTDQLSQPPREGIAHHQGA